MQPGADTVRVWDPIVRAGHWTLVAAFFTAYVTEDDFLTAHVWAGYVVGTIVLLRIIWGFVGSENARFVNFLRPPRVTFAYLGALLRGDAPRHLGHNPAGAAMIVAILLCLCVTVYSGLAVYAVEENAGPLSHFTSGQQLDYDIALVAVAQADGDESGHDDEDDEDFQEEVHEVFANLTLILVVVHVLGVLGSSYLHRENLVRAMATGRKRISTTRQGNPN